MKTIGLFIMLVGAARGRDWQVCGGGSCDFSPTPAGVNAAIQASNCGDVIKIQAGVVITVASQFDTLLLDKTCNVGNELVLTSSQSDDWLPGFNERVMPGYLPHLPLFDVTNFTSNLPVFRLDTPGTKGVILRNLAIRVRAAPGLEPYSVIKVGPGIPTSLAALASNITLDRIYITGDFDASKRVRNPVQVDGSINVLNSFFDDIHKGPNEEGYHVYISNHSVGPFRLLNNYFGGGVSIGSLTGGSGGVYFTEGKPHPHDYIVEGNYFYNSPRFYEGSPNYVGDANRPCIKNIFELKTGSDALIRWNGGENSFNGCGSQWNGFVYTVRNIAGKENGLASLSPDRLTVTISGFVPNGLFPPVAGQLLGVALVAPPIPARAGPGQFEFRTIVTADNVNHVYTVDAPYSATLPNLTNAEWGLVSIPWGRIENIYTYGNFLRNVGTGMLTLGRDDMHEGGILSGLTFKNNLLVNESPLMSTSALQFFQQGLVKVANAGENINIDNNQFVVKDSIDSSQRVPTLFFQQEQDEPARNNITTNLRIRNNVASWGSYGIFSSGVSITDLWNLKNDVGLDFRNNLLLGLPSGPDWSSLTQTCTAPRICRDNQLVTGSSPVDFPSWLTDLPANEYSLKSTISALGYDESRPGANLEEVPLIRGLTIVPGVKQLAFQWRVSQVLRYTACSLEVSAQSSLIEDTGTFTLVDSQRPDYFKRGNLDQYNPRASILSGGIERTFQVGEDWTVTDDTGTSRYLALNPNTQYYYRIMCGGASERGSTRTLADVPTSAETDSGVDVDVNYRPLLGTRVRARYSGMVEPAEAMSPIVNCATECTVKLPWNKGRSIVIYVDELDQNGAVVLPAERPLIVPTP